MRKWKSKISSTKIYLVFHYLNAIVFFLYVLYELLIFWMLFAHYIFNSLVPNRVTEEQMPSSHHKVKMLVLILHGTDVIWPGPQGGYRVCESIQHSVFDKSKRPVYIWYTSVWSPLNLQADAERFQNERIIVKTGLAWCPKPDIRGSAALYAINRHSNISTRSYQGLRSSGPKR